MLAPCIFVHHCVRIMLFRESGLYRTKCLYRVEVLSYIVRIWKECSMLVFSEETSEFSSDCHRLSGAALSFIIFT